MWGVGGCKTERTTLTAVGMPGGMATGESLAVSYKTEHTLNNPAICLLDISPNEMKACVHKKAVHEHSEELHS